MMRALTFLVAVALLFTGLCPAVSAQTPPAGGDRHAGEELARRVCDACHIVAAHQELAPLLPNTAPSFFDIAERPGTTRQSLGAFLTHPHPYGQMPYPELTTRQIADLSTYILSLRRQH